MNNIRFILVEPSHPGNIGAVARAMKTMGFTNLYIVNPKTFPHEVATAFSVGAYDILESAKICKDLDTALIGVNIVFGTSARKRSNSLTLPTVNPRQASELIRNKFRNNLIAIVFGRENNGLNNNELLMCNYQIIIPTNPNFCSVNLSAAVQLIAYEINNTNIAKVIKDNELRSKNLASFNEMQYFYNHLFKILVSIKFIQSNNNDNITLKLKKLFNRTHLEKSEVQMLHGILSSIEKL